jgi:hypothetical protein
MRQSGSYMAMAGMPESTWRKERSAISRLGWAFVISLLLHLLFFGTWYTGNRLNWWDHLRLPPWLRSSTLLTELIKKNPTEPQQQIREMPLEFVEVSQPADEPPKDAKFYSDRDSKAANPEVDQESTVPKIDGQQTEIVRTEDVPRPIPVPLQPAPPQVEPPSEPQEELKPKPAETPGDLVYAKPDPTPAKEQGDAPKPRPRRIAEALARQAAQNNLAGMKMKQEGGVRHRLDISSLDAKGSEVGVYDYALVQAVQQSWYTLLDEQRYASDYRGKVVLQFRLHHDGKITEMRVAENTAGPIPGLICETAVDKPQPFQEFPPHLRRMVGDTREIQFTFYYY